MVTGLTSKYHHLFRLDIGYKRLIRFLFGCDVKTARLAEQT